MNSDPLSPRYASIVQGIRLLQQSSAAKKVFGADLHQFRLNPPLKENAVSAFESRHRIRLPEDYRGFLLHVGNGGAGPAYGLFRLGEMDDSNAFARWKENNGFVGTLSLPFPHTGPWNDLSGKPAFDESREMDQEYEYAYNELLTKWEEEHYWNTCYIHGAIPICHIGCAYREWLIITGPERGNVWNDSRVDEEGLYPVEIAQKPRASFLQWYCDWLDNALAEVS